MQKFKGTPGPWVIGEGGDVFRGDDEYHCIAGVIGVADPECDAENAKLIAAAPELLEALEAMVLFTKPTKSNAVALNLAHAAIRKALGEELTHAG